MNSIPPIPPASEPTNIGHNPLARELTEPQRLENKFFGMNWISWKVSLAACISATMSYGYARGAPNLFEPMLEYQQNTTTGKKATIKDFAVTNAWILLGISLGATCCGYILPKIGNKKATII